jgi:hypothetical protein
LELDSISIRFRFFFFITKCTHIISITHTTQFDIIIIKFFLLCFVVVVILHPTRTAHAQSCHHQIGIVKNYNITKKNLIIIMSNCVVWVMLMICVHFVMKKKITGNGCWWSLAPNFNFDQLDFLLLSQFWLTFRWVPQES